MKFIILIIIVIWELFKTHVILNWIWRKCFNFWFRISSLIWLCFIIIFWGKWFITLSSFIINSWVFLIFIFFNWVLLLLKLSEKKKKKQTIRSSLRIIIIWILIRIIHSKISGKASIFSFIWTLSMKNLTIKSSILFIKSWKFSQIFVIQIIILRIFLFESLSLFHFYFWKIFKIKFLFLKMIKMLILFFLRVIV